MHSAHRGPGKYGLVADMIERVNSAGLPRGVRWSVNDRHFSHDESGYVVRAEPIQVGQENSWRWVMLSRDRRPVTGFRRNQLSVALECLTAMRPAFANHWRS